MKRLRTISPPVLLVMLLTSDLASAYAKTPTQMLRQTNTRLNKLLQKKAKPGSPQDERVKSQIKKQVNTFLDFAELAKRAMGRHWAARSEAEKQEFIDILRRLIERNYTKQLRSNLGYKLEYRKETVEGDKAIVVTAVKVQKKKRTSEITIEYKMLKAPGGWMVYDVVTDEVSIVRNYRSQFNRIIRRQSYEALVKKMRRKLAETAESS